MATQTDSLITECRRENENCVYTMTSFYIWLRVLRAIRGCAWAAAAAGSILAAHQILRGNPEYREIMAFASLAGVILPGVLKAIKIDATIKAYEVSAVTFNNLAGEFRRAAEVWSLKSYAEFEVEAKALFKKMNEARKPALSPPEWVFQCARRKVKRGELKHDIDSV